MSDFPCKLVFVHIVKVGGVKINWKYILLCSI